MREIWLIRWNFREFSADGQESEIIVVQISRSLPELGEMCEIWSIYWDFRVLCQWSGI